MKTNFMSPSRRYLQIQGTTPYIGNDRNYSYFNAAQRLSAMVAKQPVPAEQLLVKYAELLAEFKTLDNLTPAGQKLNFFAYHSLDVIGALLAVILTIVFLLFALLKCLIKRLYRFVVPKKDKND